MKTTTLQYLTIIIITLVFLSLPILTLAGTVDPRSNLGSATPSLLKDRGDLPQIVGTIVRGLLGLLGVLLIILIIYAGFIWGTAKGDTSQVQKAKNIIITAVVGLTLILGAYAITLYIFKGFNIS
ncbi:MAG TPA: hypothetical protein VJB67_02070 [Patescibacteria group bacterium]|nr:hypothetical protein [Patescibacteria group bacterium]